ncbi:hypothetical protein [Roseomonas marmotae]|uniref:Uncharacterized protein n=1 Tax=Roseomonas marmotae TaxID=2768161 RepID=A0ABS3KBM0_9PROT|nr:hypothetical protein [Roseomonas marmotae]MBO1073746.1 hypothetical protein [Roseomonas marmotae]QTI78622.1 hypothetical protein IAI58_13210 [Roseomonas marmotae]
MPAKRKHKESEKVDTVLRASKRNKGNNIYYSNETIFESIESSLHIYKAKAEASEGWDGRWDDDFKILFEGAKKALDEIPGEHTDIMVRSDETPEIKIQLQGLINDTKILKSGAFKALFDTIQWIDKGCKGKRPNGPSGMGDLQIRNNALSGRPDFAEETQRYVEIKPSQARRHVIAWHNIRSFINSNLMDPNDGLENKYTIDELKKDLEGLPDHIRKSFDPTTGEKRNILDEPIRIQKRDPERALLMAAYAMNSNPNNLWAGSSWENSTINASSESVIKRIEKIKNLEDLRNFGNIEIKDPSRINKEAHDLAASIINIYLEDNKNTPLNGADVQSIDDLKKNILETVISGFEMDILGAYKNPVMCPTQKEDPEALRARANEIWEIGSIVTRATVLGGPKPSGDEVRRVMKFFLTYPPDMEKHVKTGLFTQIPKPAQT